MIEGYPEWMAVWVCDDEFVQSAGEYPYAAGTGHTVSSGCQWNLWEDDR